MVPILVVPIPSFIVWIWSWRCSWSWGRYNTTGVTSAFFSHSFITTVQICWVYFIRHEVFSLLALTLQFYFNISLMRTFYLIYLFSLSMWRILANRNGIVRRSFLYSRRISLEVKLCLLYPFVTYFFGPAAFSDFVRNRTFAISTSVQH